MARLARFRVTALMEFASQLQTATVTVDRASGVVSVRPLRRRRLYTLPLSVIASWLVRSTIRAEQAEKRASRRAGGRR